MSEIFGKIFGGRDKHPSGSKEKEKEKDKEKEKGGAQGGGTDKGGDKAASAAAPASSGGNAAKSAEFCKYILSAAVAYILTNRSIVLYMRVVSQF